MKKSDRITLRRPSPSEASAASAPSVETEFVELRKPLYDFLIAQFRDDALVSRYISDKIAAEIVRLSKMRDGPGWDNHTRRHQRKASDAKWTAWEKSHNRTVGDSKSPSVRVRVCRAVYEKFMALDENRLRRVATCGEIVGGLTPQTATVPAGIDWNDENSFITVPSCAADHAKAIARDISAPWTRIVSAALLAT